LVIQKTLAIHPRFVRYLFDRNWFRLFRQHTHEVVELLRVDLVAEANLARRPCALQIQAIRLFAQDRLMLQLGWLISRVQVVIQGCFVSHHERLCLDADADAVERLTGLRCVERLGCGHACMPLPLLPHLALQGLLHLSHCRVARRRLRVSSQRFLLKNAKRLGRKLPKVLILQMDGRLEVLAHLATSLDDRRKPWGRAHSYNILLGFLFLGKFQEFDTVYWLWLLVFVDFGQMNVLGYCFNREVFAKHLDRGLLRLESLRTILRLQSTVVPGTVIEASLCTMCSRLLCLGWLHLRR